MTDADYRHINRCAWEELAALGSDSSQPWGAAYYEDPYRWLDPEGWIRWQEVQSVLCLASGGGQQAPLFASLGCTVTVVDLSGEQLRRDRLVAAERGLTLECIEGDMLELSALYGRHFDLVFQAVSACYIPEVATLYREVAAVTAPGGWYLVEHWNPIHLQLAEDQWDGGAYRVNRPQRAGAQVPWTSWNESRQEVVVCMHYIHPLSHLIGQLCDAGFTIHRFGERELHAGGDEPGSHAHLAGFLPPFMKILARRGVA